MTTAFTDQEELEAKQGHLRRSIKKLDDRRQWAQTRLDAVNKAIAENLYLLVTGEVNEEALEIFEQEAAKLQGILTEPFDPVRKTIQQQINEIGGRISLIQDREKKKAKDREFRMLHNTILEQKCFSAGERNRLLDLAGLHNKQLAYNLINQISEYIKMGVRKEHFAETVKISPLPIDGA